MSPAPAPPSPETDAPAGAAARGWYAVLAPLCVGFVAFVVGSLTMYLSLFPAEAMRRSFQGGLALYDRVVVNSDPLMTDFWQPARTDGRGVLRHDPARAHQGLTLYSSSHDHRVFLIDMSGRVVHEWFVPYSRVWERGGKVSHPRADPFVHIEKAHLLPGGDLLVMYTAVGDTPWGYGLAKVDRNGRVIWKYLGNAHHDFALDTAGNIFVLTHEVTKRDLPGFGHLNKPRIDDFIVKLAPDGRVLQKLWLTGVFAQSRFGHRLHYSSWWAHVMNGDYLHTNSIQILEDAVPGIAGSGSGQALVSMRDISTIALIDMTAEKAVWAAAGPWLRQHDAQVLPGGRILLFDNEGAVGGPGPSRVLEFDPGSHKVNWSYGDRPGEALDSATRSSQSRLDNGNTLIVESRAGRLIEVTPTGDIVWEFVNPVRRGAGNERIPIIFWVQRLDPQRDLAPAFRDSLALE